jgi:hypothetical protein
MDLPQGGTIVLGGGESPPEVPSGCPSDSGEGKIRSYCDNELAKERLLQEERNIFARRDSIHRTPPGTPPASLAHKDATQGTPPGASPEQPDGCVNPLFSTETSEGEIASEHCPRDPLTPNKRPKKRKKRSSPANDAIFTHHSLRPPIEEGKVAEALKRRVGELMNFVSVHQNVHREVKLLTTEISELYAQVECQAEADSKRLFALQEDFNEFKKTQEEKIVSLQDEIRSLRSAPVAGNARQKTELDISEAGERSFSTFQSIAQRKWTRESLSNVSVQRGDVLANDTESSFFFVEESRDKERCATFMRLLERYPELDEGEFLQGGSSKYKMIEITTKIGNIERKKKIYAMLYDSENDRSQENLYNMSQEIRQMMEHNTIKLTIVPPIGDKNNDLKKLFAYVFHGAETQIVLKISNDTRPNEPMLRRNVAANETIIIKNNDKSYADTLKKIKDSLNDKDKTDIKSVRKSTKGEIVLKVTKGKRKDVSEGLKKIVGDQSVRLWDGKTKVIHLKGLDPIAEEADISEALRKLNFRYPEQVNIKSLRPTYQGEQMATIILNEVDARTLGKENGIRVGLSICKAIERIEVIRCYRCWEYDHIAKNCQKEDRSKKCRKCAGNDHLSKDCKETDYCPICVKQGHQAGTSKCHLFREALKRARDTRVPRKHDARA